MSIDALNDLPIKTVNGATIYIRDVAYVHDGSPPQRNVVRVDGRRAVLMTILKSGSASTPGHRRRGQGALAEAEGDPAVVPAYFAVGDQSLFVKGGRLRRGEGGGDRRRRPDHPDDPVVPGLLAIDGDHRHLHPPGDPGLHRRPLRPRPDAEHYDPGRSGPGGGHTGGRRPP